MICWLVTKQLLFLLSFLFSFLFIFWVSKSVPPILDFSLRLGSESSAQLIWCYLILQLLFLDLYQHNLSNNLIQRWKTEAIQQCDVIVYTKIFLKFPHKFWPCGPGKEFFIYAHERRGYYTFWQVGLVFTRLSYYLYEII